MTAENKLLAEIERLNAVIASYEPLRQAWQQARAQAYLSVQSELNELEVTRLDRTPQGGWRAHVHDAYTAIGDDVLGAVEALRNKLEDADRVERS